MKKLDNNVIYKPGSGKFISKPVYDFVYLLKFDRFSIFVREADIKEMLDSGSPFVEMIDIETNTPLLVNASRLVYARKCRTVEVGYLQSGCQKDELLRYVTPDFTSEIKLSDMIGTNWTYMS